MSQDEKNLNEVPETSPAPTAVREEKKKFRKLLLKIFLWFTGSIITLLILILIFINPLVRFAVTTIGSAVTGTEITLDEFDLSLLKGKITLNNFRIANPAGFKQQPMLELGHFHAAWDNSSLLTDNIFVENIKLDKLHITAEVNKNGLLNFLAMLPSADKVQTPEAEEIPETADTAPAKKVWIKQFSITDFRFIWHDDREQNNIHGFAITLQSLTGSMTDGQIELQELHIENPDNYDLEKMLSIAGITTSIEPETIYSPAPVISKLHVSGLAVSPEFNWDGGFNILDVADSFSALFASPGENNAEPDETEYPASVDDDESAVSEKENTVQLKHLLVESSRLTVYDDRVDIPVIIPLALEKSDKAFTLGDTDILEAMHNFAVKLRDACMGITNADEFISRTASSGMEALNNLAQTGLDGLSNVAESGKKLLQDTAETLKPPPELHKKTVKKLVEIFK